TESWPNARHIAIGADQHIATNAHARRENGHSQTKAARAAPSRVRNRARAVGYGSAENGFIAYAKTGSRPNGTALLPCSSSRSWSDAQSYRWPVPASDPAE